MHNLDTIRSQLTETQKSILNRIWSHWVNSKDQWIPVRSIYHEFGKSETLSNLEKLSGSILFESYDPSKRYSFYKLTFLGILLTDQGDEIEELLVKYLEYTKEQYAKDPLIEKIEGHKIHEFYNFSVNTTTFLGRLFYRFGMGNTPQPCCAYRKRSENL